MCVVCSSKPHCVGVPPQLLLYLNMVTAVHLQSCGHRWKCLARPDSFHACAKMLMSFWSASSDLQASAALSASSTSLIRTQWTLAWSSCRPKRFLCRTRWPHTRGNLCAGKCTALFNPEMTGRVFENGTHCLYGTLQIIPKAMAASHESNIMTKHEQTSADEVNSLCQVS